jgi:small subunit ribosomal protein S12e
MNLSLDHNNLHLHSLQLCKIDSEGKARKVVGCSCVVVKVAYQSPNFVLQLIILVYLRQYKHDISLFCFNYQDYGEESEGLNIVQEYVKSH